MERADFPGGLPDDEIIRRLRSDDEKIVNATLEYLRRKHEVSVEKLIQKLGGDPGENLGIVLDDTLLAVLRHARSGNFDPAKASLKTWFLAIAKNTERKRLNQRKRLRLHESQPAVPPSTDAPLLRLPPADRAMEEEEKRKRVAAAIQKLDEPCRKMLIEHWWEDKPLKDIAGETGKSDDATKQRHHRCLKKLRELLENDLEDWF